MRCFFVASPSARRPSVRNGFVSSETNKSSAPCFRHHASLGRHQTSVAETCCSGYHFVLLDNLPSRDSTENLIVTVGSARDEAVSAPRRCHRSLEPEDRPPVRQRADQHASKAADRRRAKEERADQRLRAWRRFQARRGCSMKVGGIEMPATIATDDNLGEAGIEHRTAIDRLADQLVLLGQCDLRTIERGRLVAEETGQRLDTVLIQLGLLTERGLADAYAALLRRPVATAARYPADAPLFPDRLTPRFLRSARALPLAIENEMVTLAVADPLDTFTPAAVSAAVGRPVAIEIALPIELDAALGRLYPDDTANGGGEGERLRCRRADGRRRRAAEGSGERGAGHPARESDHLARRGDAGLRYPYRAVREPAARALPLRRRAARGRTAAGPPHGGDHVAHQDHGPARHRRAPPAAGRPHQARGARHGDRFPRLDHSLAATARRWCCACSTAARSRSTMPGLDCRPSSSRGWTRRSICRTASCSSPGRPAAARRRPSIPGCSGSIR